MRSSDNEYKENQLRNGFDYDLQVWVENYIIQPFRTAQKLGIAGKDIRFIKRLNKVG